MNHERMREIIDEVLEEIKETIDVEEIIKLKEYPEIFHIEEVNT